jgi:hypothetical protein
MMKRIAIGCLALLILVDVYSGVQMKTPHSHSLENFLLHMSLEYPFFVDIARSP